MSDRLRDGLTAPRYGYKWKDVQGPLALSVWTAKADHGGEALEEMERVEAEVAYWCRHKSGQWPVYQHEIRFHPSGDEHRTAAAQIYDHALEPARAVERQLTAVT